MQKLTDKDNFNIKNGYRKRLILWFSQQDPAEFAPGRRGYKYQYKKGMTFLKWIKHGFLQIKSHVKHLVLKELKNSPNKNDKHTNKNLICVQNVVGLMTKLFTDGLNN